MELEDPVEGTMDEGDEVSLVFVLIIYVLFWPHQTLIDYKLVENFLLSDYESLNFDISIAASSGISKGGYVR